MISKNENPINNNPKKISILKRSINSFKNIFQKSKKK